MNKHSKILVVGHNDVVEKSLTSYLQNNGYPEVISSSVAGLDVLSQVKVEDFFQKEKPEYVFLSSVRSGGISANQNYPAEFIYSNLQAQNNIIHAAYTHGVKKLLFLASSCVYPKETSQPIKSDSFLAGPLELTSEAYSVAKIAGIKMCQAYRKQYGFDAIAAVPATVYGPGSDSDVKTSHVLGALLGKFCDAIRNGDGKVEVWGTGKPRREFLYSDDLCEGILFLMENYSDDEIINMGYGSDVSIKELAETIASVSGFGGEIVFDETKPDGTMQKFLDSSKIFDMGWKPKVELKDGIDRLYKIYKDAL